jgi:hypothetical protein
LVGAVTLLFVLAGFRFACSALRSKSLRKKKEKKEMKLAKVIVPAIAMMAMALGSTPAQAAQPKIKIGVAMALFDDVYVTNVRDAMTKWASAHPDVDLTIVDAANDTAKQVGQVENFLAQGMDAVVILPVDTAATGPMTKAVVKAGKPLVYVNRQPSNLPKGVRKHDGPFLPVVMEACLDDQLSFEYSDGATVVGAFTFALTHSLNTMPPAETN